MSTGAIIAIVVGALIVIGVVIALIARARSGERALNRRRQEAAGAHRQQAEVRGREAEQAEQRAKLAQAEAERHRADARLQNERAEAYEQGRADDRLRDGEGADGHGSDPGPGGADDRVEAHEEVRR
jgi:flagellar biosynthesis/type III secretory pathway M-ring protein FliF/YscJ